MSFGLLAMPVVGGVQGIALTVVRENGSQAPVLALVSIPCWRCPRMLWQPRQVSCTFAEAFLWNVSVSLASCAKKIGSRPARPIGDPRHVPYGEILISFPCASGLGCVMSYCRPVPPAL